MKVLTSPSSFGQVGNEPVEILEKNGFEVVINPYGRKLTHQEVIDLASDCIGIVAGVEPLTAEVIDALPQLRVISRVGVGLDNVDIAHAEKKGIIVRNTPMGPTRAVAEMTLAMTLCLMRKIPQAHLDMKSGIWKKQTGNLIQNKVVGILGMGNIGKLTARLFRNIDTTVIGFDPNCDKDWADQAGIELAQEFDDFLKRSDIVSLHIPSKADKKPVITKNELGLMKKSSLLVNMSRGGVVDEDALYQSLSKKEISGAAIDVFSEEPYNGRLCELDNVVLTPHLGSYALEGKLQMEIDAVENLIKSLN